MEFLLIRPLRIGAIIALSMFVAGLTLNLISHHYSLQIIGEVAWWITFASPLEYMLVFMIWCFRELFN